MGGLMMEVGLMMVVMWVDDGGLGIDQVDGGQVQNILQNKCVEQIN